MNTILVTGSNGFVGSYLSKALKSHHYKLIEIDYNSNTHDLCDWNLVKNIPQADTIVHLAGKSYIPDSFENPLSFYNNNIISTLNILEKAKIEGSKVIFFSTYVYGVPKYLPIDEKHETDPQSPYTQSKLVCEELCKAYHRDFGVSVTVFRPFNIYGPGQKANFFIPTIISQIREKFIYLNDSRPKRDFIYIDDVIDALLLSIKDRNNTFEIYNLGTEISSSVKEIVELIIKVSKSKANVIFSEQTRKGEVLETLCDISKIRNNLNWHPTITIEQGLKLCVANKF
jgi:nucleoside-diphosphate-sugar epimerase